VLPFLSALGQDLHENPLDPTTAAIDIFQDSYHIRGDDLSRRVSVGSARAVFAPCLDQTSVWPSSLVTVPRVSEDQSGLLNEDDRALHHVHEVASWTMPCTPSTKSSSESHRSTDI